MKRLKDKEQEFVEGSRDRVMFEDMIDSNNSRNVSENNSNNVSQNVSKNDSLNIVIKKNPKPDSAKRVSYYLKSSTIRKIEKLANKNDMYISEFLQKLLDEILDKIIIEE